MQERVVALMNFEYRAAARPANSVRQLVRFIGASDYGWCATLCHRLGPRGGAQDYHLGGKGNCGRAIGVVSDGARAVRVVAAVAASRAV